MTHAGLLVLLFATQSLGMKRLPRDVKSAMARGHKWYADRYTVERVPWGNGWHTSHFYYYMYGLERYAQFFGFKKIAGRDWYEDGAEELLARQGRTGGWGRLEETCFAILFLRKVTFSAPTERKVGKVTEKEDPPKRPAPDASLPFLRDWLLAGPFPAKKKNEDTMLQTEHFSPSKVKPAPVGRAGKEKWFRYRSDADEIDFKRAGRLAEWSTYYAACYLHAAEAAEAVFWIGAEDGFRLFLNGKQVFDGHHHGYSGDDHYRIPLRLAAGRNLVMLKIENVHSQCRFKVRVDAPEDVVVDIRRKGR